MKPDTDGLKSFWLFILVFFTVWNFSFEIKSAVFSPLEAVILILIGLTVFKNSFRHLQEAVARRYLLPFAAFLLPMIPARFLIVDLHGPWLQIAWRVFRNLFELIPWIFFLVLVNIRRVGTLKTVAVVLVVLAALSSVVGTIQTFSDGRILTGIGPHGNFKYLGLFPPLSPESYPLAHLTLGAKTVISHAPDSDVFRAHGGANNHNHFGAFLIPTLSLTVALCLLLERRRIVFFLLALPQVMAVILCLSRGALVGLAVALAILWVMVKNRTRSLITILLLFLIVFSILTVFRPDIMEVFTERTVEFADVRKAHGMEPREEAWRLSAKETSKRPLIGHGTGSLKEFKLSGIPLTSHNEILDILYSRGAIALAGWLVFLFLILKDSLAAFKAGTDPHVKAIGGGIFAGLLGMSVTGLTQILIHIPDTAGLIWLCCGLAATARRIATQGHDA